MALSTSPARKQDMRDRAIHLLTAAAPDGHGIEPGDTIYCSHHAPSTYLKLFVIKPVNNAPGGLSLRYKGIKEQHVPVNITLLVAQALELTPKDKNGSWYIHNPVVGMDRGFDIVRRLSRRLFNDDYAISQRWL